MQIDSKFRFECPESEKPQLYTKQHPAESYSLKEEDDMKDLMWSAITGQFWELVGGQNGVLWAYSDSEFTGPKPLIKLDFVPEKCIGVQDRQ